ncbi:MAG: hypothetical protein ACFFAQ_15605 [Promethearchaeota archaeon]
MKSEKLKFTILISILILTIFPITFNLMIKNSQEERPISIFNLPKLSAETEWVPNGTLVCDYELSQSSPQICSDGEGGAIIVWWDLRNLKEDLYAQRIDANGNLLWAPNGTMISILDGTIVRDIDICSDGFGGAIIVWREYLVGTEYNIYAQKVNADGITQWAPNGTAVCTTTGNQLRPKVCSDGMGGGIISWDDERNGVDCNIYAQRINATGDIQWIANGTAICTRVGNNRYNQIMRDDEGGAIITWASGDIYAQKINASGIIQWDANGSAICAEASGQTNPQLCNAGYGDTIITWEDYRNGDANIYAQKINSNATGLWDPDGIKVDSIITYADHADPQLCSDGAGGAIIAWIDQPGGGPQYYNIFAQRVNSSGTSHWTYDRTICDAGREQGGHQICSDGEGGAIIVWYDDRNNNRDAYAQKIQANGSMKWGLNGRAICNLTSTLFAPQLCSDDLGGAIITWDDDRGTSVDIYASRVDDIPYSNHPEDFETYSDGSEIINWILFDDTTGGKYRVIANDTAGNTYVWLDWTSWDHNIPLDIPLNRTELGFFSYRIEYYDELNQYGIPDAVIVLIKAHPSEKAIPLGHYYLLFIILSVAAIIIIKKFRFQQKSGF